MPRFITIQPGRGAAGEGATGVAYGFELVTSPQTPLLNDSPVELATLRQDRWTADDVTRFSIQAVSGAPVGAPTSVQGNALVVNLPAIASAAVNIYNGRLTRLADIGYAPGDPMHFRYSHDYYYSGPSTMITELRVDTYDSAGGFLATYTATINMSTVTTWTRIRNQLAGVFPSSLVPASVRFLRCRFLFQHTNATAREWWIDNLQIYVADNSNPPGTWDIQVGEGAFDYHRERQLFAGQTLAIDAAVASNRYDRLTWNPITKAVVYTAGVAGAGVPPSIPGINQPLWQLLVRAGITGASYVELTDERIMV